VYLSKVGDTIYVLHSFVKKSAKTSRNDLAIASNRLQSVQSRLREERKNAHKEK
jgi:phage-related protein